MFNSLNISGGLERPVSDRLKAESSLHAGEGLEGRGAEGEVDVCQAPAKERGQKLQTRHKTEQKKGFGEVDATQKVCRVQRCGRLWKGESS